MSFDNGGNDRLSLVRELYDGMGVVITAQRGVSEFLEYFLTELAPDGVPQVRRAVKRAHDQLGLTQ